MEGQMFDRVIFLIRVCRRPYKANLLVGSLALFPIASVLARNLRGPARVS